MEVSGKNPYSRMGKFVSVLLKVVGLEREELGIVSDTTSYME
jgi:hypothetical protein